MAAKLIKVEGKPITKELATWLFNLNSVPGERSIKKARLASLKCDFEDGNVTAFRWAYATCNGVTYRVNGQHTSYLLQNGEPIPPGAICSLEYYHCDTTDDLCRLWALFDSHTSSRTNLEVTATYQTANVKINECRQRTVHLCKSALGVDRFGFGYLNKVSTTRKLDVLKGNEEFICWADKWLGAESFRRAGIALAMLKTYRVDQAAATAFWDEVQTGSNPDRQSGSRVLQYFLLTTSVKTGAGARTGKRTATFNQIATAAVTCWNYWRQGKKLNKLYLNKDMSEAI